MNTYQGFSLTEVLVALFLVTTASLTLLKQQWQTNQFFNHLLMRSFALTLLDNNSERIYAGQSLTHVEKPFYCQKTATQSTVILRIGWEAIEPSCCNLQRQVVASP